ncbi:MAG: polyamine ABC transporter substrate-binding protein [Betaproteobacteria bacterium HGW-Betaproteobacteria-13]|jgi:putative spermidine/putrescine transport system permease protein|uniref:Polyamine ABC transporter substrate-binding protein n=1 Tax=Parazoarcus communis TaxID=41977 RepID=A0A2U8GZJ4_9RHOO|nr:ABC transporter permease [Parazoarcus communis]AWI78898.1 polyamine ABC transporter substrate-binding protein [Parazoarcus communis]PKO80177.1 MAG: polyamine ABC transporter substrate-binding protein [Betaproteobacteria bacterium HGW-Betaproteobacteria-13]
MTAASNTADALVAPAASAPSLKKRLRRAEMRKKLLYGALILPLAVFLLVAFVWPIASLLTRSVDNPEVHENLPLTLRELKAWDGKDLPSAAAFSALAEELESAKGSPAIAEIAKRLNREETGYRSLIMKTARKLPLPAEASSQSALIDIDARWGEAEIWQAIRRSGSATTPFYLLAAIDRSINADGDIVTAPPEEAVYVNVLMRTFWMSLIVTGLCLVLGFPVAYLMAKLATKQSNMLMFFVLLPFWTSVLVRVAAWIILLQNEGLINKALIGLGITDAPMQLLFNRIGVYVSMVHILLPFMVLPLYSVMKGISPVYVRAAISLGCPPFKSFWKVYFPQTLPGIGAGALLVFIMCMGYYITPALLGSPQEQMVSYFIAFYTNQTINWGMAAALSAVLLAATLVLYMIYARYLGPTRVKLVKPR